MLSKEGRSCLFITFYGEQPLSIHNVPIPPNPYISSATDEKLYQLSKTNEMACIEITGASGLGKTRLVQQLIHQHLNEALNRYALIGWIDCSSVNRMDADLLTLSQKLGHASHKPQEAARQLLAYCEQHPNHLLICDALDSENFPLERTALQSLQGQLIYTTRSTLKYQSVALGRTTHSISLSSFVPLQAQQLVAQCLPEESLQTCDFSSLIGWTACRNSSFVSGLSYVDSASNLCRVPRQTFAFS